MDSDRQHDSSGPEESRRKPKFLVVLLVALLSLYAVWRFEIFRPGDTNTTPPQWVTQHTPHAQIAIVFVHGIFGDTLDTWKNPNGESFFNLVSANKTIGQYVDTYAFGYTSNMFRSGSFDIQEAANALHERLIFDGVLGYPQIVFVAHSMGGLVTMKEILTHREQLKSKVPMIVLYATPQEGAQISAIAKHVANNEALEQMLPADKDGYLRGLNDEWKAQDNRPQVRCAYEKRPTKGITIVPWESATRFCDGAAVPVDADHISIVKPSRPDDTAVVTLVNGIAELLPSQTESTGLQLPDFHFTDGKAVLTISDPHGVRLTHLVNESSRTVRYWLKEFPDEGIMAIPDLQGFVFPHSTDTLRFYVRFEPRSDTYRFVLETDHSKDQEVIVKIENLEAVNAFHRNIAGHVAETIGNRLQDEHSIDNIRKVTSHEREPGEQLIAKIGGDAVKDFDPSISDSDRWILTAEVFGNAHWSQVAAQAASNLGELGAQYRQKLITSALKGTDGNLEEGRNVFVESSGENLVAAIANNLEKVPGLAHFGYILQGDLANSKKSYSEAYIAYSHAAELSNSQYALRRLDEGYNFTRPFTTTIDPAFIENRDTTIGASTYHAVPNEGLSGNRDIRDGVTLDEKPLLINALPQYNVGTRSPKP